MNRGLGTLAILREKRAEWSVLLGSGNSLRKHSFALEWSGTSRDRDWKRCMKCRL